MMKSDPESTERPVAAPLSLDEWEPPHPVARAIFTGTIAIPEPPPYSPNFRNQQLAMALAELNRRWGNPVDRQLAAWLAGARVVVSGQQPGLLGGPLLSLIKACAVAAQVAKLQAEGHEAVGFFWLETRDDDLPEMGWARLALGGELYEAREDWRRGKTCACAVPLSSAVYELLDTLPLVSPSGRKAFDLARASFQPGMVLGEACGRFFGQLLSGLGVVLVDASIREVAFAAQGAALRLLHSLSRAWELLEDRQAYLKSLNLDSPLKLQRARSPFFHLQGGKRYPLSVTDADWVKEELRAHPEHFSPNVWVRPLLQDAVLDTTVAILGSSELAYHWLAQDLWALTEVHRPLWLLRPHVTVVSPREKQWMEKLGLSWEELLQPKLPQRLLPSKGLFGEFARRRDWSLEHYRRFAKKAAAALPNLASELEATDNRLQATFAWLEARLRNRAEQLAVTKDQRFTKLRQSLRPLGRAQERALSVLSPLLDLGEELPPQLVALLQRLYPWQPHMFLATWQGSGKVGTEVLEPLG